MFTAWLAGVLVLSAVVSGAAQDATEPLDQAWWTGPMLAPSAATLPRGHVLLEPYFYDVTERGRFDAAGSRRPAPPADTYGSLTYALYGITDRLTAGVIPTVSYQTVNGRSASSGLGDLTTHAEYRLAQSRGSRPGVAVALEETLPTARYDRLAGGPASGLGGGAWTTTLALYTQTYLWLPNGRILRMRVNLSQGVSSAVAVRDVSVYGTPAGFRGRAQPGDATFVDAAWEYSVTRKWVLALDATFSRGGDTTVAGAIAGDPLAPETVLHSGTSRAIGFAPAFEYNFRGNVGVLLGVRVIPIGRNTTATVTPAIAINFFR